MPLKNPTRKKMFEASIQGNRRADSIDAYIGKRIREYRLLHGLTQQELAKGIGVKFQQLQKYEKGNSRCSFGRLVRIAQVINVPLARLLGKYVDEDERIDVKANRQFITMVKNYQRLPKDLQKLIRTLTAYMAEKSD